MLKVAQKPKGIQKGEVLPNGKRNFFFSLVSNQLGQMIKKNKKEKAYS